MNPDKETRADAKLQNLPEEDLDFLWRLRHPEKGGQKMTLEAIAVMVPGRYGFTISVSSLSNFYKWLRLRQRIQAADTVAEQFRQELAKDPNIAAEDLDEMAAKIFKTEMLTEKNASGYLAVANFQMRKERFKFEREKFSETTKGLIQKGLDALQAEIQGNPKAMALFKQLQEVVAKA
jgi:hypothetical protein